MALAAPVTDALPEAAPWLPPGKRAAVCLSVDDVHPGTSADPYEAGGDLDSGALGRLRRLQQRHPRLRATLCVTPSWRLDSLVPNAGPLRYVPWLRHHVRWTRLHPAEHFRLDRHPRFVAYLNELSGCEVVLHGLHHAHVGQRFTTEFQAQSEQQCVRMIEQGLEIFRSAGLRFVRGYVPPAWNAPPALLAALERLSFSFVCSARDIRTAIHPAARTAMSGLSGVSLTQPQLLAGGRLVHLTCNFQATSPCERALQILDAGGLLHIKAHIFKDAGGHSMLDGLDDLYCNYLDLLLERLERRYGQGLWWPSLSQVAARMRATALA
jgi:hypothetical protein